jgi:tape measure domain-containing protein
MEKIQQSLVAATGTSEKAAVAFDFVRKVSIELGLNLRDSAQAFSQLAASAKGTSLEGRQLELIFEAVAKAGRVLNLSSAEIKGTIVALRQTIGKARVSAEELRRQLGDRLPGAFQIAARAMGVTTQELDKMLEKGELLAVDLLPRFADEMNRTFGPGLQQALESTAAKIGRVQTAFFEAQAAFGAGFAEGLGETLETVTERTAAMEEAFGGFGQTLGFVASIASRLFNFLNQFFAEAQAGIAIANSLLLDLVQKGLDPILVKLAEISRGFSKFADAAGFKEVAAEAEAIAIFLEETGKHLDEDTRNARAFAEAAIEVAESLGEVSEESAKLAEKAEAAGNAILEQVEALKESGDLSGEVMIDLVQQAGKAADAINELGEESRQSLEGLQKDLRDAQEEMRKTPEFIKESIDRLMEQTAAMREAGGATANEAQKVVAKESSSYQRKKRLHLNWLRTN